MDKAFIALGSNLGNSMAIMREAMERLREFSKEPIVASSLWSTTPVDCPPGSPPFVNAVVALTPSENESPETLLHKLQALEREFGRRPKTILNEARPLDLDLISFGNVVRDSAFLVLPHPRAHQRKFVLQPLAEIAPDYILPGQTRTVRALLDDLHTDEVVVRLR